MSFSGSQICFAAAAKTERLEAHRFQSDVARGIIKSAQEILRPYFRLIGQSKRRALSKLALSGQLFSGAKRWLPLPAPTRGHRPFGKCQRCATPSG